MNQILKNILLPINNFMKSKKFRNKIETISRKDLTLDSKFDTLYEKIKDRVTPVYKMRQEERRKNFVLKFPLYTFIFIGFLVLEKFLLNSSHINKSNIFYVFIVYWVIAFILLSSVINLYKTIKSYSDYSQSIEKVPEKYLVDEKKLDLVSIEIKELLSLKMNIAEKYILSDKINRYYSLNFSDVRKIKEIRDYNLKNYDLYVQEQVNQRIFYGYHEINLPNDIRVLTCSERIEPTNVKKLFRVK